jgi:hypothetical protein
VRVALKRQSLTAPARAGSSIRVGRGEEMDLPKSNKEIWDSIQMKRRVPLDKNNPIQGFRTPVHADGCGRRWDGSGKPSHKRPSSSRKWRRPIVPNEQSCCHTVATEQTHRHRFAIHSAPNDPSSVTSIPPASATENRAPPVAASDRDPSLSSIARTMPPRGVATKAPTNETTMFTIQPSTPRFFVHARGSRQQVRR